MHTTETVDDSQLLMLHLTNATDPELKFLRRTLELPASAAIDEIADTYRRAAGHAGMNWYRGEGPSYHQILIDVADALAPGIWWTHYTVSASTPQQMEGVIQQLVDERRREFIEKLSDNERERVLAQLEKDLAENGFPVSGALAGASAGALAATFGAAPIAVAIFYHGLFAGMYAAVFGPALWAVILGGGLAAVAVGAPLAVAQYLAAPEYSKTVPATLALIAVAQRVAAEARLAKEEAV